MLHTVEELYKVWEEDRHYWGDEEDWAVGFAKFVLECNKMPRGVDMLPNGKYRARGFFNKKLKHLGVFDDKHEAHEAYLDANNEYRITGKIPK